MNDCILMMCDLNLSLLIVVGGEFFMLKSKKKSIQLRDFISIGVYSAIYFILVGISAALTIFVIPGYSYAFIPVVSALLSGTVFMLMVAKVPRFGAISIMGSIMGIFFLIVGRFPGATIVSIVFSVIADMIANGFNYKNKAGLMFSYVVFSFNLVGPVIPMLLFPSLYMDQLIAQGRDASYIEGVFASVSEYTVIILTVLIIVMSIIGGMFGQRMMRKHFNKAGIV